MPYTKKDYPQSMKNLIPEIRHKAIDILNVLIDEEKMEIGYAIPTAISRAKDWAANRGKSFPSSPTDQKKHGDDVYVIPLDSGWAIKKEKRSRISFKFDKKSEAVSKARDMAKQNHGSMIVQRKDGRIQSKTSYTS